MRSYSLRSAVVGLAALAASPAYAVDILPGDYTVLPAGTNLFMVYGQYSHADSLNVDFAGGVDVPDSELGVGVGIARYVHYTELGGVPLVAQAILPFGGFSDARIGGANPPTEGGLGDLTVGLTVAPIHSAEPTGTTVGLTAFVTAPTGAYEFGSVNLGSGTWTFTPQVGVVQGLGNGFFLDLAADVAIRGDHNEQGVDVSRKASGQVQAYLRYQFSQATNIAIGYSGTFGGKDYLNDVYQGTETRVDQLRLSASTFLAPTVQLTGMVGTDVNVDGGFKNDFVGTIRLLTLF